MYKLIEKIKAAKKHLSNAMADIEFSDGDKRVIKCAVGKLDKAADAIADCEAILRSNPGLWLEETNNEDMIEEGGRVLQDFDGDGHFETGSYFKGLRPTYPPKGKIYRLPQEKEQK